MIDVLRRVALLLSGQSSGTTQSRIFISTPSENTSPRVEWFADVDGSVVTSPLSRDLIGLQLPPDL